jgi:hypothetical protein
MDNSTFLSSGQLVEEEMKKYLLLSESMRFPVRRLCTLWRSHAWQPMITKFCATAVGRDLFSISVFELMLSCRMDAVCTSELTTASDMGHGRLSLTNVS